MMKSYAGLLTLARHLFVFSLDSAGYLLFFRSSVRVRVSPYIQLGTVTANAWTLRWWLDAATSFPSWGRGAVGRVVQSRR